MTRRLAIATLAALVSLTAQARVAPPPSTDAPRSPAASHAVTRVRALAITVADLERSAAWYRDVLGFEIESVDQAAGDAFERLTGMFGATARVARLRLGEERIELVEFATPTGRPVPADTRANDRWFQHAAIVVSDMDEAYRHLQRSAVRPASDAPQRLPDWNPSAGGIRAYYFRDPDGHFLEIIEFPSGKGDPRWQDHDRLFLGIDHTAIVVADTDAALAYYRDALGLHIAGHSENYGLEQEHLNGVFPARLRITTLRADSGPGVELLEYLTPTDGRPAPADARPSDLWHWHVVMECPSPDAMFDAARAAGGRAVSPGAQALVLPGATHVGSAFLARDPDGHATLFVEPAKEQPR